MLSMAEIGLYRTSRIFVAGAENPGEVRAMGMAPVPSVEDGLAKAEMYVGRSPRVLALPGFLTMIPPHLFAKRKLSMTVMASGDHVIITTPLGRLSARNRI